ncbi:RDD family protein [Kutzneria viridogrisea]|uniref:RDD family membrane protein YckC n=1 Tax=Kutzneria viridogrisea TaxID=47990 RepID=A0ABR6BQ95_9PSEU|nr:putative RDD family membrane protein YckC [Kutzneria viridogrisea]
MIHPLRTSVDSRARTEACLMDCLVVLTWLLALSGVALGLRSLGLSGLNATQDELTVDAITLVVGLGPVAAYLILCETGQLQASWGKRRVGLRVVRADGSRAGLPRLVLRTVVKLLPWYLAHWGLSRLWLNFVPAQWATTCLAAVYLLVPITIGLALVHPQRRALHDWLAGTKVITAD